jgi:hypothetical protein
MVPSGLRDPDRARSHHSKTQTYLITKDLFTSHSGEERFLRGSPRGQVYLAALRHFEGPRPLRRRLRRESGPGRLGSRSARLNTVPPRPSSIISASSTTFLQKVRAARPVAALQQPHVPDALHRVPAPCLHRASRVPLATVQPQLPSARRSIQLCTVSAAER